MTEIADEKLFTTETQSNRESQGKSSKKIVDFSVPLCLCGEKDFGS
jgi:hypothetical protein